MYKVKMVRAEIKLLSDESSSVMAVVSTEDADRDGDIIRATGWHLDNFMRHPVLLSSHDYGSLKSQIGEWTSMEVRNGTLVGPGTSQIELVIGRRLEQHSRLRFAEWALTAVGRHSGFGSVQVGAIV